MNNAWEVSRCRSSPLGHGHTRLSTFYRIIDLSPPVAHSAYDKINEHLGNICAEAAQEFMDTAVKDVKLTSPNIPRYYKYK